MAESFGLKLVEWKTTSEVVHILIFGNAYNFPRNQKTYILVHNEMFFFVYELDHKLLNPNQILNYGIPFWDNQFDNDRWIVI